MSDVSQEALRQQELTARWLDLISKQLELAIQLRQLISEQRKIGGLWESLGVASVAERAREVEHELQLTFGKLQQLEHDAVQEIRHALAEASEHLKAT
jgi:hypothetical protein